MKFDFHKIEDYRLRLGPYGSNTGDTFGVFYIPFRGRDLKVIATDGEGISPRWEHVSVSLQNRCPNWEEMSYVKSLFWRENETVVQYHPKKSAHVNQFPYALHLWKKYDEEYELPPSIFVGIKP